MSRTLNTPRRNVNVLEIKSAAATTRTGSFTDNGKFVAIRDPGACGDIDAQQLHALLGVGLDRGSSASPVWPTSRRFRYR
jgi:hypothetical protein